MAITDTIDPQIALQWMDNWRTSDQRLTGINGFLVPGADLSELIQESGAVDARAYLGIDTENQFHLLFVGVDADGNDMVDPDNGQYVYDLTKPCPPMCSQTGPFK